MDHAENLTSVRIRKTVQKSIPVDYMDLKCTQASKRQQQNPNSTPWIRLQFLGQHNVCVFLQA
ncbi:hypothetical protein POPTR_004G232450v4 [Populus trichocarpa]|uniref:Uncharacterized protein n=1 Tax=Populus trichocarpa TaxID=3694 RepID=A0ACC0T6Z2_POPTR|nr:hypothetical protein POPTR_004G232450v4 [Populus trichocarpa]